MRPQELHLLDYLRIIARRRWVVIASFVVIVTGVTLWTLKQTPIYRASATLMIEPATPKIVSFQEVMPMGPGSLFGYADYYSTQLKLIRSRSILKKVVEELGLKAFPNIDVQAVRDSRLVVIAAEDPDPVSAANIANTLVRLYVKQNLGRNLQISDEAVEWLSQKIKDQREKLRESEYLAQKYREEHNITALPQITGEVANENIKGEYARYQAQLANYSQRYTDKHPKIIELKAQIDSLKNKIQGLEEIGMGKEAMEYRVLERDVGTNKRMYELLLTRLKEASISSTLTSNNISIVDEAQVPGSPVRPNPRRNIALAVVLGLFIGIGLAFFFDYMDHTIRTPLDVENLVEDLKSRLLGIVPDIKDKSGDRDKIVFMKPRSPASEAYRSIRTEILHSKCENLKSLLVTSAEPLAGKTITLVNLGIAFAQNGSRVLLVDSDLRKPRVHEIFELELEQGLSEYLAKDVKLNSIIKDTGINNLQTVTAGEIPSNPAEIISSGRMSEFLDEASSRFDFLLFDSPPITSVADASILANKLDAVLQVVRSGKSHLSIVISASNKLAKTNAAILGIVLNGLTISRGYYYYSYYGDYK